MRIYLDNCCYNRPYDDQTQMRIYLETQAKLFVQDMVCEKKMELVTSYMLEYENGNNGNQQKKRAIQNFMDKNAAYYVGEERVQEINEYAKEIMLTGIKEKDAIHLACSIFSECDYFLTTDDRVLKYKTDRIQIITPTEFVRVMEGKDDDV